MASLASSRLVVHRARLGTPVGDLHLFGTARGLQTISLPNESRESAERRVCRRFAREKIEVHFDDDRSALDGPLTQIEAYFAGSLRNFDLRLDHGGTAFQRAVWSALALIPYGETWSYGDVAREIGRPTATRAVGAANGANPLPIIFPCHRVIGSSGALTGYGGGLPLKERLLAWERREFVRW